MREKAREASLFFIIVSTGGSSAQDWEHMASPVTTPVQGIWGTTSSNVYAVGSGCVIIHHNGTTGDRVTVVAVTENLNAIHGSSDSNHRDGW